MKRIHLLGALAGLVLLLPLAASSANRFPDVIALPDGFQPEGIAIGPGHTFYVGSIPTGRVWKGDLRTGESSELVPTQPGRNSIGLAVDHVDACSSPAAAQATGTSTTRGRARRW